MSAIDPCGVFPREEFFSQHKIKPGTEDYEYTRCFIIFATSQDSGVITRGLKVYIVPVFEAVPELGTPRGTGNTWEDLLARLLDAPAPTPALPADEFPIEAKSDLLIRDFGLRTALDFTIARKSCILIRIIGSFWGFSREISPVTTKHDYGGHYHSLEKHWRNPSSGVIETPPATADYRCISFFSGKPCRDDLNVRHGFSFNIDLIMNVQGREERLPITVDPDVENKGDN